MHTVMVAIDLSERSDRALRRAILVAKKNGAELALVHVVDDNQPAWETDTQHVDASDALQRLASTIEDVDMVSCSLQVPVAPSVAGVVDVANALEAGLVVIGPHKRNALKDLFVDSTAEQLLGAVPCPVLMANALPLGPYRHVMQTTDLSDVSAAALKRFASVDLGPIFKRRLLHVFDAPGMQVTGAFSPAKAGQDHYLYQRRSAAEQEMATFVAAHGLAAGEGLLRPLETTSANDILRTAQDEDVDLVVISTHGRGGIAKLVLGSVAAQVLARSSIDVLILPPLRT